MHNSRNSYSLYSSMPFLSNNALKLCVKRGTGKYCTHPEDVLSCSELFMSYRNIIGGQCAPMLNSPRKMYPETSFLHIVHTAEFHYLAWHDGYKLDHRNIKLFASAFKPSEETALTSKMLWLLNHVLVTSCSCIP